MTSFFSHSHASLMHTWLGFSILPLWFDIVSTATSSSVLLVLPVLPSFCALLASADGLASWSPCGNSGHYRSLKTQPQQDSKGLYFSGRNHWKAPRFLLQISPDSENWTTPWILVLVFSRSFQRLWGHLGQECAVATAFSSFRSAWIAFLL